MKLKTIVAAKKPMQQLAMERLPMKTAHDLYQLAKKLDVHNAFFEEKRLSILEECAIVQDGKYVPKPGQESEMNKQLDELLSMEINEDWEKVKISMANEVKLTMVDIIALEPFVEFVEG